MLVKARIVYLSCMGVLLFANGSLAGKEEESKVAPFFELQDLFESVRIPNIVVAADGTVLAFAKSGQMLRRSEDGGKNWGPIQEVGPDSGGSAIVDDNTGHVMVVNSKSGYLWRSCDHGKTWTKEDIVIKPNAVGHGTPDRIPVQTTCSESGVTLQYGKHKGRLLMPASGSNPLRVTMTRSGGRTTTTRQSTATMGKRPGRRAGQCRAEREKGPWRNCPMATSTIIPAVIWR